MHSNPPLPPISLLPPDDPLRNALHNEVHARPSARIRLPALVLAIALRHPFGADPVQARQAELEHLRRLPGQQGLSEADLDGNFVRLRFADHTLLWERHNEFSRYTLLQALPANSGLGAVNPDLDAGLALPAGWLAGLPGRTVAALQVVMVEHQILQPEALVEVAQLWFGGRTVVASMMGRGHGPGARGHSLVVTDLQLRPDGFERMLVVAAPDTSALRAGRIAQRLTEIEIYRLMALRGLPRAKTLAPQLAASEAALSSITARLDAGGGSESELLDALIRLAAQIESTTAGSQFRFAATQAYHALVQQRLVELRESPVPGIQTLGDFMQRRLSPAIATVAAAERRLNSLSQRVERASALLRTRVDIAREAQNQQLLAKLTDGQAMQLRLQSTVEGLSIAAISYYVISLLLYGAKALKAAGVPINPELAAGLLVPVVVWGVWRATQRIHKRFFGAEGH